MELCDRARIPEQLLTTAELKSALGKLFFYVYITFSEDFTTVLIQLKATHHKSRMFLHSVHGHSHSNLLHCMGGDKQEGEQEIKKLNFKKQFLQLLYILPVKRRKLEGCRHILSLGN